MTLPVLREKFLVFYTRDHKKFEVMFPPMFECFVIDLHVYTFTLMGTDYSDPLLENHGCVLLNSVSETAMLKITFSAMYLMDRQICPDGHILASRGTPSDAKL